MSVIDRANAIMNNNAGTSYASDPKHAVGHIVATSASDKAVETLIKPEYKFFFTPATDTYEYSFKISAAGTFYIDWDDGEVQTIVRESVSDDVITHTYTDAPANTHEIKLAGRATRYSTTSGNNSIAAVRFYDGQTDKNAMQLQSIRGCLGCVFPTITDTSVTATARQPRFRLTFGYSPKLTSKIPPELFNGVTGAPVSYMFSATFRQSGFTGEIPGNLFDGLNGAPATYMFNYTFAECGGLNNTIPENLFAGIRGKPATYMFAYTFYNSAVSGDIPENLFAGIDGAPANYMFYATFNGCTNITSIPAGLFTGIHGAPADYMFRSTFAGCTGLTFIPSGLFAGINGKPAAGMYYSTFSGCSGLNQAIPAGLFGTFDGEPANYMFYATFYNCSKLPGPLPEKLFAGIDGAPATYMFRSTFRGCRSLDGEIPENMFGNIYGEPASYMFYLTFERCSKLTGPSARIGVDGAREYLYERWPYTCVNNEDTAGTSCYTNTTGFSDWADIPTNWGGKRPYDGPTCAGGSGEDENESED